MTKTIRLTITLFLLAITLSAHAKVIKFYYTPDKDMNLSQVVTYFFKGDILKDKNRFEILLSDTIKINKHIEELSVRKGIKTPIKMEQQYLDIYKVKAHYLAMKGGGQYGQDLYEDEVRANKIANSYDPKSSLGIYYKYIPIYTTEHKTPYVTSNDFSSIFGMGLKGRYSYNNTRNPVWASFNVSVSKFDSPTGYAQTTPTEKKKSLDAPLIMSGKLKSGLSFRGRNIAPYIQVDYSSHLAVEYVTAKDESDIRKIDVMWLGAGVELLALDNKVTLDISIAYSALAKTSLLQFSNETNDVTDEDIAGIKLSFGGEYTFNKRYFAGYQFEYVKQTGNHELASSSHAIVAGITF